MMLRYKTLEPVTIHSGVLGLTREQSASRMTNLCEIAPGTFRVERPVMFKRGESICYDGDLPRRLAVSMEATEPEVRKPKKRGRMRTGDVEATMQGDEPDQQNTGTGDDCQGGTGDAPEGTAEQDQTSGDIGEIDRPRDV